MKPLFRSAIIILGVLLAIGFDEASASSLALISVPSAIMEVKLGCKLVNGQLICGKKKSSDDDADNDDQSKKKKKTGNICEGDNHCGAGETDLETPNKYKACCEPAGGFQTAPKAPAPTEAKECGFGMIGTPPNHCDCPAGTEFKGFKGCVAARECCQVVYDGKAFGGTCGLVGEAREDAANSEDGNGRKPDSVICKPQ